MSLESLAAMLLSPVVLVSLFAGLIVLFVVLMIVCIRQSLRLSRLDKKYRRLLGRSSEGNLEEILASLHQEIAFVRSQLHKSEKVQEQLMGKLKTSLRGLNITRYNAFQDTGSDLSFSFALLDEKKDGVVISSIYGREESRTYAKPIVNGASTYHLSTEEEKAIRSALENMSP